MTEITNENFRSMLPVVKDSIRGSTFVAIDTEMTGLVADHSCQPSLFDTPDRRYSKIRQSVRQFVICQIGLSVYTYDHKSNMYRTKTYSFYLCPRSASGRTSLALDVSAIEFLVYNNFDFDKFARLGINYLNEVEEQELRDNFDRQLDIDFIECPFHYEDVSNQVSDWLSLRRKSTNCGNQLVLKCKPTVNPLVNYALVQELRRNFPSIWVAIEGHRIVVKPKEMVRHLDLIEEELRQREQVIDDMIGFSAVFKLLVEAKRPIVGHNLLTDLLIIYNSFYKPLPKRLKDLKTSLHSVFPYIFDTKCILMNEKHNLQEIQPLIKNKSLAEIYSGVLEDQVINSLIGSPKIDPLRDADQRPVEAVMAHNAGFDAFATGFIFIKIGHILLVKNDMSDSVIPTHSWFELLKAIEKHCNKLNLIRANTHYICLEESEPIATKTQWLLATKRTKNSKLEISRLTSSLSSNGTSDIKLIGHNSVLIAVSGNVMARSVMDAFREDDDIKVSKYNVFRHNRAVRGLLWTTFAASSAATALMIFKLVSR